MVVGLPYFVLKFTGIFKDLAVQNDEYLTFFDRYAVRMCIDFSTQAMKEAARHLKGKGILIQGDMMALPIADNCIDS